MAPSLPRKVKGGWWRNPESNWGHKDFQSSALPTELFRHITKKSNYNFARLGQWIKFVKTWNLFGG